MHIKFTLSKEVLVQRRVVYDIFMMFGDVGGLQDFILIVLAPLFSYFSSSFMSATLVSKLYHASESEPKPASTTLTPLQALESIKPIPFSSMLALMNACLCKAVTTRSRRLRTQAVGEYSLERQLDLVRLVR